MENGPSGYDPEAPAFTPKQKFTVLASIPRVAAARTLTTLLDEQRYYEALRLLDKQAGRLTLDALGMAPATRDAIDALIQQPHGILLVTGPTGSGKTTTLYSALSRLDRKTRNILTVEDPIEYELDGVGQTQVNPRIEMTFARALRAILRQDPDVVMVGEIRDAETIGTAMKAAETGHLLISTLHTPDAPNGATPPCTSPDAPAGRTGPGAAPDRPA